MRGMRTEPSSWVFRAIEAVLFAAAGAEGEIGIHYAGPTWDSESGSKVSGAAITNAPSPNIFAQTTYVQRVKIVGGRAPVAAGQIARVPYAAAYFFYRETH